MLPIQSGNPKGETEIPVYDGVILSRRQTQTDTASVLRDKDCGINGITLSFNETQPVMNDKCYRESCKKDRLLEKRLFIQERKRGESVYSEQVAQSDRLTEENCARRPFLQGERSEEDVYDARSERLHGEIAKMPKSQQGGPRPGCKQEDQRSCQSDFPVKAPAYGRLCLSELCQFAKLQT
jgi:hypothetical protein